MTRHSIREERARCLALVVDDVEINREMVRIVLEKQGHRVIQAGNGQEALDLCRERRFDIIFLDMQMPVLDGYEAARAIRELELQRLTPIVAMTAYALQGDRDKCLQSGADAYLSKPARPTEIIAVIDQLVPDSGAGDMRSGAVQPNTTEAAAGQSQAEPWPAGQTGEPRTEDKQAVSLPESVDASLPVFDVADLVARLGGSEEMVARFVTMFTEVAAGYLQSLRQAVAGGDLEQTRIQAHTIKGAAANISAWRLREIAGALENLSREGSAEGATGLLRSLEDGFTQFNKETESYRQGVAG